MTIEGYEIKSVTGLYLNEKLEWRYKSSDAKIFTQKEVDDIRDIPLSQWVIIPAYLHKVRKTGDNLEHIGFLERFWLP